MHECETPLGYKEHAPGHADDEHVRCLRRGRTYGRICQLEVLCERFIFFTFFFIQVQFSRALYDMQFCNNSTGGTCPEKARTARYGIILFQQMLILFRVD